MNDELDTRLRRSFEGLTGAAETAGVYERVAAKRARRRRVHRARIAAVSIVGVVALGVAVTSALRDGSQPEVAARGGSTEARVVSGADLGTGPVTVAGSAAPLEAAGLDVEAGYVRGPLLASGGTLALASYDRDGPGFTVPPARVLRLAAPALRVRDRVELQGEIVSLADGEGARWALTHDKNVLGPEDPEYRIKRIASDGTVVSNPVPPGSVPVGDIVASGGGVWLPVSDGVLRFDSVTGEFADRVALGASVSGRGVAAMGKFTAATDGTSLIRLDPGSARPGAAVLMVADGRLGQLEGVAGDFQRAWLLGSNRDGTSSVVYSVRALDGKPDAIELPREVKATGIHSANGVTWIEATIQGHAAALVLSDSGARVERTIVLPTGNDVTFTFLGARRAIVAVDGHLRTIDL